MIASSDDRERGNLVAIAAMVGSQAVFTVNDTLMKLAARDMPGGQAIFIRSLLLCVLAGLIGYVMGAFRRCPERRHWPLLGLRSIGDVGATFLYLAALFNMPIADATAILQFLPLAITAGAALFLGEPVGWRRWLAAAVGLVGVLIIIRPGTSAFNIWSLVALAAVAAIVLRDLSTRRVDKGIPTILLTAISGASLSVASCAFALTETWRLPSPSGLAMLTGATLFVLAGYYLIIEAMRRGEVAVVSPFRYSVILWAILAGMTVFGEKPDPIALLGTAVVMAAGLYTFFRERQLALRKAAREGIHE
ncbi:MAG: DMT family transporter [Hyphomicrobiaceae bacterium]